MGDRVDINLLGGINAVPESDGGVVRAPKSGEEHVATSSGAPPRFSLGVELGVGHAWPLNEAQTLRLIGSLKAGGAKGGSHSQVTGRGMVGLENLFGDGDFAMGLHLGVGGGYKSVEDENFLGGRPSSAKDPSIQIGPSLMYEWSYYPFAGFAWTLGFGYTLPVSDKKDSLWDTPYGELHLGARWDFGGEEKRVAGFSVEVQDALDKGAEIFRELEYPLGEAAFWNIVTKKQRNDPAKGDEVFQIETIIEWIAWINGGGWEDALLKPIKKLEEDIRQTVLPALLTNTKTEVFAKGQDYLDRLGALKKKHALGIYKRLTEGKLLERLREKGKTLRAELEKSPGVSPANIEKLGDYRDLMKGLMQAVEGLQKILPGENVEERGVLSKMEEELGCLIDLRNHKCETPLSVKELEKLLNSSERM